MISLSRTVGSIPPPVDDAVNLLPHLLQFTEEHQTEAMELQDEIADFAQELKTAIEEAWKVPQDVEAETSLEGWAARMQEYERQKRIDPLDKVSRPELVKQEWNKKMSHV